MSKRSLKEVVDDMLGRQQPPSLTKIRLAQEADIPFICQIVGQLSPTGFEHDYRDAREKFKNHIEKSPDYFLWVATVKQRVVGTAITSESIVGTAMMHLQHKLSYQCGTAAHLEDLVVDENWRGHGVGKLLLENAINTAEQYNCYKLMLTCWPKSIGYFMDFGFVQHDFGMRKDLKHDIYRPVVPGN